MKVVCDNCRAVYKIPDTKLVKPINKATCRNCGYRMLIPRPPTSADSDFSTLVTAVPPTPMGAPPRETSASTVDIESSENGADSTEVIKQPSENTKPGDQKIAEDDMLLMPDAPSKSAASAPGDGPESVPDDSFLSGEEDTRVTEISKHAFASGDTVKAPSPLRSKPELASNAHDPSADLTIAILGTLGAMVGTFPMAALVFSPNPFLLWFGQAIAFGGATTALLILLTGGRGTRPASRVVSIVIGGVLAVLVASIVTGMKVGHEYIDWAQLPTTADSKSDLPTEKPEDLPTPDEAPSADDDVATDNAEVQDDEIAAPSDPTPTTAPKQADTPSSTTATPATTNRSSTAARTPRPSPRPRSSDDDFDIDDIINSPSPSDVPEDDDELDDFDDELDLDDDPLANVTRSPAQTPKPQPKASDSVPIEVIDVMLRNHMEVKKCFYYYAQSHGGKLPPRVDIKFTLQPTGRASSLTIKQSEHSKTDLEQCLRTAIGGITFPPTSKPQKLTYPFVLQ